MKYPHLRVCKVTEEGRFIHHHFQALEWDKADASYRAACSDHKAVQVFLTRHKMALDPKIMRSWSKGEHMPKPMADPSKKPTRPQGGSSLV